MRISIFGLGYVGCVSLGCLAKMGHTIVGVDMNKIKVDQINSAKPTIIEKDIEQIIKEQYKNNRISATTESKAAVLNSELSIIAVGTPSTVNGHLNIDNVYKVAKDIGDALKEKKEFHIIAIRSTVVPGTCARVSQIIAQESAKKPEIDFAVVSNPEFLREGSAVKDYFNPPITLIGTSNENAGSVVAQLYNELPAEVVIVEENVSEIMKYVNNTFHALKISFANEIGNICKALKIDSNKVMDILIKDKQLNISPYYLKPGFAYGGSCLPKDLLGLQIIAHDNYVQVPLIENINKTNELQIKRAFDIISRFNKKKICMMGLSFKKGTDDLRNSPFVILAEQLVGKGFDVKIYDKNVHLSNILGTNQDYIQKHIPHLAKLLTADFEQALDSSELVIVSYKDDECMEILKSTKDKIIIDLIGVDNKDGNYHGINW